MISQKSMTQMRAAENEVIAIAAEIEALTERFVKAVKFASTMTGRERQRLYGTGVRNYGFIEKAWDIARGNPEAMPSFLTSEEMGLDVRSLEHNRQLLFAIDQLREVVNQCTLVSGDKCYHDALHVYNGLKEQSRANVHGAAPLYESLSVFFSRHRKTGEHEPTQKELERDFKKLLHGKADGEIVIKNESPKVKGGVRKVVDNVRKGRASVKKTAEAKVSE